MWCGNAAATTAFFRKGFSRVNTYVDAGKGDLKHLGSLKPILKR